jgi:hypothetical protein
MSLNHLIQLRLQLLHYHLLRLLKLRYLQLRLQLLHYHLLRLLKLRYLQLRLRLLHYHYYNDYCDDDRNYSSLYVQTRTADLTSLLP